MPRYVWPIWKPIQVTPMSFTRLCSNFAATYYNEQLMSTSWCSLPVHMDRKVCRVMSYTLMSL